MATLSSELMSEERIFGVEFCKTKCDDTIIDHFAEISWSEGQYDVPITFVRLHYEDPSEVYLTWSDGCGENFTLVEDCEECGEDCMNTRARRFASIKPNEPPTFFIDHHVRTSDDPEDKPEDKLEDKPKDKQRLTIHKTPSKFNGGLAFKTIIYFEDPNTPLEDVSFPEIPQECRQGVFDKPLDPSALTAPQVIQKHLVWDWDDDGKTLQLYERHSPSQDTNTTESSTSPQDRYIGRYQLWKTGEGTMFLEVDYGKRFNMLLGKMLIVILYFERKIHIQ